MAQNNLEKQLRAGIRAAQQGDRDRARELIEGVLRVDRDNELAWVWMASIVQSNRERRVCFERVLKINPNNTVARDALNAMTSVVGGATSPTSVDYNAMSNQARNRMGGVSGGGDAGARAPRAAGGRTGGLSRQRLVPLLGGAAILLGIILIGTLAAPIIFPAPTPTPTFTPTVEIVEVTEEPTVFLGTDTPVPTPTLGALVTVDRTAPPTFTPTSTGEPTITPTATATLPAVDQYQLLYIARQGETEPGLYQVNGDSSGNTALIEGMRDIAFNAPTRRIAFVRTVTQDIDGTPIQSDEIYLTTLDDLTNAIQVTQQQGTNAMHPTFSPDGSRLMFVSNADGDNELYVYNIQSNSITQLTNNNNDDNHPDWSPDAQTIAFASDRVSPGSPQLFLLDLSVGNADAPQAVSQLTDNRGVKVAPAWSPDGQFIAFVTVQGDEQMLSIIARDGTRTRTLSRQGGVNDFAPTWSNDSIYVIFVSDRATGTGQIFAITRDGENTTRVSTEGLDVQMVVTR